ncbi:hypothetical protein ACA910_012577 [Epithemia clementina (nom. ined.)]
MSTQHNQQRRRQQIVRACKTKGWSIQPGPLEAILNEMMRLENENDEFLWTPLDFLHQRVEPFLMTQQMGKNHVGPLRTIITQDIWQQCLQSQLAQEQEQQEQQHKHQQTQPTLLTNPSKQRPVVPVAPLSLPSRTSRSGEGSARITAKANHNHQNDNNFWKVHGLQIVSAFHQPKLVYNPMRQQFRVEEQAWSLFGTAEEKVNMLAQRYALIHQRILRHEQFRPTSLTQLYNKANSTTVKGEEDDDNGNKDDRGEMVQRHLTPLERLLGQHYKHHQNQSILVLGVLRELEPHCYYLEDPTGLVPLSMEEAQLSDPDHVLVVEDSIYLVQGVWHDGTLRVHRLGPPLLETRQDSLTALRQQIQHPLLAPPLSLPSSSPNVATTTMPFSERGSKNHPIVILCNVHLDQPHTLQQLEGLLTSYEVEPHVFPLFCFMGNFSTRHSDCATANSNSGSHHPTTGGGGSGGTAISTSTPHAAAYWQSLLHNELAGTIRKFPRLALQAHFVLIPGPNDVPPSAVLPWILPRPLQSKQQRQEQQQQRKNSLSLSSSSSQMHRSVVVPGIPNMLLGTNPTRLYWNDQEWVLFRSLPQQLQQVLEQDNTMFGVPPLSPSSSHNDDMDEENDETENDDTNHQVSCSLRLIKTMLDQGHLVPGGCAGLAPIYWNYDHALRLYPLPTGLVVGMESCEGAMTSTGGLLDQTYGGCRVVVPGSLGHAGQYAVVHPTTHAHSKETGAISKRTCTMLDEDEDDDNDHGEEADDFMANGGDVEFLELEQPFMTSAMET